MDQRKLYRTIEKMTNQVVGSDEELIITVLNEVVKSESFQVTGGRLWKLNPSRTKYKLIYQIGEIEKIKPNFTLNADDYPIFEHLSRERTVLATETDYYLRKKGILKYSATGIGEKVKGKRFPLYPYMLALSSNRIDQDLFYTLNILGTALTATLRNRKLEARSKILKEDINQAAEIQKRILPEHEMNFSCYEIFGISIPDRIVGGDFFDYLEVGEDNDRLAVVVGDVASKGFSAAAEALYVAGALRMGASYLTKIPSLIKRLNNLVYRIFPDDRFVSLFYIELMDDNLGLGLYCNAGHNSPIFFKSSTKKIRYLESTGPLIGPAYNTKYTTGNINMELDDFLLIYTDGIPEAMNSEGDFYGEERLEKKVIELSQKSAKEISQMVVEDVQKFSVGGKYSDDRTVVVIKRIK
ncbi:MAG: PP2C family protein-serine/threonine phosphatase [Ignavibacteria bacterium]|nr:PP2C family protein-serine/threonine phosphatase [Ignavibacteria bacterium]